MPHLEVENVMDRLRQLDEDAFALTGGIRQLEIVVVGGSAFVLRGLAPDKRFTVDIDVLHVSAELELLLARHDMNTDVATFLYRYPQRWEERLVEVPFDSMCLRVLTPSNEDLAIMKALAWREQDQNDLRSMAQAGNIDREKLAEIVDDITELQANLEPDEWEELLRRLDAVDGWMVP